MELDFTNLRRAIAALDDGLDVVKDQGWFGQQSVKVQNTLIAGVIQGFECAYELSFKMLRRQLEVESEVADEIDHMPFRDILRLAAEKGFIHNVDAWFKYRAMRNITSHTYDHEKAQHVYHGSMVFIDDARLLLKNLENRYA